MSISGIATAGVVPKSDSNVGITKVPSAPPALTRQNATIQSQGFISEVPIQFEQLRVPEIVPVTPVTPPEIVLINREFKDLLEILKNKLLEKYRSAFSDITTSFPQEHYDNEYRSHIHDTIQDNIISKLNSILFAYDERISENDFLIKIELQYAFCYLSKN